MTSYHCVSLKIEQETLHQLDETKRSLRELTERSQDHGAQVDQARNEIKRQQEVILIILFLICEEKLIFGKLLASKDHAIRALRDGFKETDDVEFIEDLHGKYRSEALEDR